MQMISPRHLQRQSWYNRWNYSKEIITEGTSLALGYRRIVEKRASPKRQVCHSRNARQPVSSARPSCRPDQTLAQGETFAPASQTFRITRSLPHGHVEAVLKMIHKLGLDDLIASEPSRQRNLVMAMVVERLVFPSSKLANTRHWHDSTLAEELEVTDATEKSALRRYGLAAHG
jgi:hypothetical protein